MSVDKLVERIDKVVLAVDPQTRRARLFVQHGYTNPVLGQHPMPMYHAFEGVSRMYSLSELKNSSFQDGAPLKVFEVKDVYTREDANQGSLF